MVMTKRVSFAARNGVTVRVTVTGPGPTVERIEKWLDAGRIAQGTLFDIETRRFRQPLERYRFPLQSGASVVQARRMTPSASGAG
jgi:hypothetical protein